MTYSPQKEFEHFICKLFNWFI